MPQVPRDGHHARHTPGHAAQADRAWRQDLALPRDRPRLRLYRPLEVRLWRDEEILLDLPEALQRADPIPSKPKDKAKARTQTKLTAKAAPADPKQALFGGFARPSRTGAG